MNRILRAIKISARRLRASSYVGRTIGDYRIVQVAGMGAYGAGFKVRSSKDGYEAFAKLVDNPTGKNAEVLLWPEVAALSKCDHPGIPAWLGIEKGGKGERLVVQTLMPGESLASMLGDGHRRGKAHAFSMREIAVIGDRLIDILAHAFSRGVMHGDVRPSNILFDGSKVSLVDFGLACFFDPPMAQVVFETDAMIDRMGLADALLFLLYSDPYRVTRLHGSQSIWMQELALSDAQRQLLRDLFAEECRFTNWEDVRTRFNAAF